MKTKIPATLRRWERKIASVDREPDGWFVSLKDGWYCTETETHGITENTLRQCAARFESVLPCHCEDCQRTS